MSIGGIIRSEIPAARLLVSCAATPVVTAGQGRRSANKCISRQVSHLHDLMTLERRQGQLAHGLVFSSSHATPTTEAFLAPLVHLQI